MNVFDPSALLAFLQGEEGSVLVEEALGQGGACGTANWSEVTQKVVAAGGDWGLAKALLATYHLDLEPVTAADAERRRLCGFAVGVSPWPIDSVSRWATGWVPTF